MDDKKLKIGDKVSSHLSLWKGEIGTISEIISDECVHVIFIENETHYGYQQTFDIKDLKKD